MLRPFYGFKIANDFERLLTTHLVLAAELVKASIAGNTQQAALIEQNWYQNGIQIAQFLSSINPFNDFEEWKQMMLEHLNFVKTEAVQLINGQYPQSIRTYDRMEVQILKMADLMTRGILQQFNIF